jgi:hypothetical protein
MQLRSGRSTIEIVETDFETTGRVFPHAAERMVLASDQPAVRPQDARGFLIVAPQVRNPDGTMAPADL